ncbi:hypothetical protein Scep_000841 [Stephania cephalantha]|uniref:non-specific serine/threonine protein kinase n=1 Tax=Stephania cephalantha TaxID=152367 RepID=A0AAP0L7X3_9MAGN
MQGLHHQQHQLAALLSVALPKDASPPPPAAAAADDDGAARFSALTSLHRAILYPPNSVLVSHSANFLSQGLSQLLSDKLYTIRRSAAVAYGGLCGVLSNGRHSNHGVTSGLVERFVGWALPLLHDVGGDGSVELALEGFREFLNVGEASGIEVYVSPILKACQGLLEDERTSLSLLHQLLGVLSLVSVKFARWFQPHFVDIIDLLLGWALVPDLSESDRCVIMDSFLQFRKHWLNNLQFSLGLLSKFLDDMDVLLKDGSAGTPEQFRRLLALFSCFLTVLKATATEMLEMNFLEQISEPLISMVPKLLSCLSLVGKKFGWSKWIGESWRCLTLLAEILGENFAAFYLVAVDILFQGLTSSNTDPPVRFVKIPALQIHGALKTNLQLLSLQKFGILSSSVETIMQFNSPISELRLHPNHLVAGSAAATYLFLLQHGNSEVVERVMSVLFEELELLKRMCGNIFCPEHELHGIKKLKSYSKLELFALFKFDLTVLLSCVSLGGGDVKELFCQTDVATSYNERSVTLASFILDKLDPVTLPVQSNVELQVTVIKTLAKLSEVEFLSKYYMLSVPCKPAHIDDESEILVNQNSSSKKELPFEMIKHLKKYNKLLVKSLHASSPLALKLEALKWIHSLCVMFINVNEDEDSTSNFCAGFGYTSIDVSLLSAILDASLDRELKVRFHAASVLELLLQSRLIYPGDLYAISEFALEKLGDPDTAIKNAFIRILSLVLPAAIYFCGLFHCEGMTCRPRTLRIGDGSYLHWKQAFALKQLPQKLHSHQLVSILSYISQRWKVPLSSWVQRLIHSYRGGKDIVSQLEEMGKFVNDDLWMDSKAIGHMLDRVCPVNNLAAAWWSIHEAARYCITVRLRTNLGGPTQTFAALERMLLDIAHILQLETEQSDSNLNIVSSGAHLLPMRLLLDFVESLKKNVYNAYDGSCVLPTAAWQSSLFFRANKKVCEEWFARICEPMMNAGLALKCQASIYHYCALRLQELHNLVTSILKDKPRMQLAENLHNLRGRYASDVMKLLRYAALALCQSKEPEALIGLQKWSTVTFSSLFDEEYQVIGQNGDTRAFSWMTGLVYQAHGQYERAAAHFSLLLQTEEALSSMGSGGIQFVIERVIDSYTALSDWKSLEAWFLELQALRAKHAGKSYSGALTTAGKEINAVHALACFDEGDCQGAWAYLDLTPKSSNKLTLDPKLALQRSEQMLLQAMLFKIGGKLDRVPQEIESSKLMLDEVLSVLPLDGVPEATAYATQSHCIVAFEDGYNTRGSVGDSKQLKAIFNLYNEVVQSPISNVRQDCNLWLKIFRVYRTVNPTSSLTFQLCQKLMTLARKQKNLMLAKRLSHWLKDNVSSCSNERSSNLLSMNLVYEDALLMHAENKLDGAFMKLWSIVHDCMLSPTTTAPNTAESSLKAKACLKLSAWLRQNYSAFRLEPIIFRMLEDFNCSSLGNSESSLNSVSLSSERDFNLILEELFGLAAKLSSHLCPVMGKAWLSYASWCYSQAEHSLQESLDTGLQTCALSPFLLPEFPPDRSHLTDKEIWRVETIVTEVLDYRENAINVSDAGREYTVGTDSDKSMKKENSVRTLVHQVVNLIVAAAGGPGVDDSNGELLSANLISQLQMLFLRTDPGLNTQSVLSSINALLDVWLSLRRRRISLFGHAAHGFMQYLSHSSSKLWEGSLAISDLDPMKRKTGSHTLEATLYILKILLNYGVELKDMLGSGLSSVPLLPWQEITPQLFARLNSHPEQVVRKQLEGLLMMLAKLSPSSIVYPTLVDINAYEREPSEELQHILGCLRKLYPRLIQDVQLLINQLGNVTVLWEELWLGTLQDLHADVIRRINLLKDEAERIAANVTLSHNEKSKINAAKYSAMMAPIIVALERRLASTSRKPETPHELWFQREYGESLKSAILAFKTPPASMSALGDVWQPFHTIASTLVAYQRKSSISLCDVAPQLELLSSSDVPMPGLEKQIAVPESAGGSFNGLQKTVTIASFCEQVTILSTKTKPKKLSILGSDGQKYTYLLKGREDLRLDARIMQLLQAVNGFLYSTTDSYSRGLAIRYYSVTPISGRAGLIQWVDNVISIYSVFKSWQNRVQLAQLAGAGAGVTNNTVPPPIPRPSDMFYGKIIPALKEKGIRRVISRRDWPHEVKRKVLQDLMKETPRQLLYQELWCSSEGFKAFNSKLNRYSGSVAAMSMVGHILGLGDRHLDNILLDFCSGDVVHIDYNVCFDKGQRLKIPEIVPFRLTQTIEAALGLTGIEGTFRANCEAVLGVLRKNKDIILMLLDVFVWDPLVEWTRGDNHDEAAIGGEERKGMELAVSLSLFASRVQEIRVPLQEHHDLLLATLPAAESMLKRFSDILNQYEVVYAIFYRSDQERSNLLLRETSAKSIVAEATSNSEKIHASYEIQAHEFAQAKSLAAEKAQEIAIWMEQHGRVIDTLRSGSLPEVQSCIKLSGTEDVLSLTSAVLVAGVPLTVVPEPTQAQCHDLDREVSQLIAELDDGQSRAIKALQEYSLALQRLLPLNYITTSPLHGWVQLLQLSVNNLSSDVLSLARRQAADLIAKYHGDGLDSVQQKHGDLCIKVEKYIMEMQKVEQEGLELMNSIGPETEAKAKVRLLNAFSKYMQSAGLSRKEEDIPLVQLGQINRSMAREAILRVELEEKKEKVLRILHVAACALYNEVKRKVLDILNTSTERFGWRDTEDNLHSDSGAVLCQFEEQVERCILVAGYVNELCRFIGADTNVSTEVDYEKYSSEKDFSMLEACLVSSRILVGQMTEVVLPEVLRLVVSHASEVMDAFGSLSQIRGSIDTALEQLVEVELEKASLIELEQNYFVKVGHITEQLLSLEEASVKSRDHLSWEEAEELASQEEACRAELDQLHQTWNKKDVQNRSLIKREAAIRNMLASSERCFLSLISTDQGREQHNLRSKALLATLAKPFLELESIDQTLASFGFHASTCLNQPSNMADVINSGYSITESVWKFVNMLDKQSFFIWKVGIMDFFLDICIHDISSADHNLGFDQLYNVLKMKLEKQLQGHISQYMRERVAPALLARLEKENEYAKQWIGISKETEIQKDVVAVNKVQLMLEEYCNAYETARAARSAASLMKKQVNELREALHRTVLEIVQMEWLHNVLLPYPHKSRVISSNFLASEDNVLPVVINLNRLKLMENIQSAMSSIARAVEGLQACEGISVLAEGQLERAMGWACAGPAPSGSTTVKGSGIPAEFHDHLLRRRQLLWASQEQASDIIRICTAVLEFEASRDGVLQIPVETSSRRTAGDVRTWQQTFLSIITRLDITYHSFTCAEQEWKLAQCSMETATNSLFAASSELLVASVKTKSASGDLQNTLVAMLDCAREASVALSAFARVSRGHTALTSECGSMLEEVLAITDGLHDVHSLGKEAAAVHTALMDNLSMANKVFLPLESVLSKDVTAMTDAVSRDRESKMEIPPIHGQAIYQSYSLRLKDACHALKSLVPSVTFSVKELHSMLIKLARTASLHAGNLHKALEGLGESEAMQSQEMDLPRESLAIGAASFDDQERNLFAGTQRGNTPEFLDFPGCSLEDDGWVSPPDSICSSTGSDNSPVETTCHDDVIGQETEIKELLENLSGNGNADRFSAGESSLHEQSEFQNLEGSNDVAASATSILDDSCKDLQALDLSEENTTIAEHNLLNPSVKERSEIELEDRDGGTHEIATSNTDGASHVARGKNPYALSVLRRVEMKLDGRDIENNRVINISEQVDYLLKQATSIDNLCNMYEGWTPWI